MNLGYKPRRQCGVADPTKINLFMFLFGQCQHRPTVTHLVFTAFCFRARRGSFKVADVTIFTLRISLWTRIELSDSFEYMWFKHLVVSVSLDQLLKFDSWLLPPLLLFILETVFIGPWIIGLDCSLERREREGTLYGKNIFFFSLENV